jgi:hypothetical protein
VVVMTKLLSRAKAGILGHTARGYGRRAVVSDELRDTVKKMRSASNRFNAIVKDMSKEFGEDKG